MYWRVWQKTGKTNHGGRVIDYVYDCTLSLFSPAR
jgi:hypothetical protein